MAAVNTGSCSDLLRDEMLHVKQIICKQKSVRPEAAQTMVLSQSQT